MNAATFNPATETRLSVRSLRSWGGRQGVGYTCDVLFDGKPVAQFRDDGDGSAPLIRWAAPEAKVDAEAYAEQFAPLTDYGFELPYSFEFAVAELADYADTLRGAKCA